MRSTRVQAPEGMASVAEAIRRRGAPGRVVALYGPVGAGKTTLVQAFCRLEGVSGEVTSPTYALVNEYEGEHGTIYHLDLYRLETLEEGLAIGLEEVFGAAGWCFVEWPEVVEPLLPPDALAIKLEIINETTRKVVFLNL